MAPGPGEAAAARGLAGPGAAPPVSYTGRVAKGAARAGYGVAPMPKTGHYNFNMEGGGGRLCAGGSLTPVVPKPEPLVKAAVEGSSDPEARPVAERAHATTSKAAAGAEAKQATVESAGGTRLANHVQRSLRGLAAGFAPPLAPPAPWSMRNALPPPPMRSPPRNDSWHPSCHVWCGCVAVLATAHVNKAAIQQ